MTDSEDRFLDPAGDEKTIEPVQNDKKGPLNFFVGALTSGFLSWTCLLLSQKVVAYFSLHTPTYNSPIAQSVASGFKTLVIGISFLATFTFGFIGIGLMLVFIRSLLDGNSVDPG